MGDIVSRVNLGIGGSDQKPANYQPQRVKELQPVEVPLSNGQDNKSGDKEVSTDHIRSVISKANENIRYTETKFIYYEDINRIAIKIVDRETDEVIREIPREETIELLQKIMESAGLLFDVKR
jgi:uncharacterized FlaG/YvyC family protein